MPREMRAQPMPGTPRTGVRPRAPSLRQLLKAPRRVPASRRGTGPAKHLGSDPAAIEVNTGPVTGFAGGRGRPVSPGLSALLARER